MSQYVLTVGKTRFFVKILSEAFTVEGLFQGTPEAVTLDLNDPMVIGTLEQVAKCKRQIEVVKRAYSGNINHSIWGAVYTVMAFEEALVLVIMKS
jgi:hypothetical protein